MAKRKPGEALPAQSFHVVEALSRYGPESLSDAQLVEALLTRVEPGRAEGILRQASSLGSLAAMGLAELRKLGLSRAEVARFAVLLEVHRRSTRGPERRLLTSSRAAAAYLLPKVRGWTEERFGLLGLDGRGGPVADRVLAHGTTTACLISPREFFREALRVGAVRALAWHNHPSGDPAPSREDIQLTRRLRAAGEELGVRLEDHLILGRESWHSFRAAQGWDLA